jgi:ribosomal protein S18 acetylase RimI-like enzyme
MIGSVDIDIRLVAYDDPDAQRLVEEVQAHYVARYGGPDTSPVDVKEFTEPHGTFWLVHHAGEAVGMGGWRLLGSDVVPDRHGLAAEIKRMYVSPRARGLGLARALLRHLERTARAAGVDWLVLETGMVQPEALALYRSCGYADTPAFGHYACAPLSVHLGRRLV